MDNNLKQLLNIVDKNKANYSEISKMVYKNINYNDDEYDFNFIIPAKGRHYFSEPLFNSAILAAKEMDAKVQLTLFEYSDVIEHKDIANKLKINYLNFKVPTGTHFNKCLAYNLSVLLTKPSKWYIFHDLDCLVQKNFFKNLLANITENTKAIQTFQKRRVLYLDKDLTNNIIDDLTLLDDLDVGSGGVSLPINFGAPGGSICVESDTFFNVGGYDPEFFHSYSPEDAFFWDKLSCLTSVELCDNPHNELFHMYHESLQFSNPQLHIMSMIHQIFRRLNDVDKLSFLDYKKKLLQ